MIRAAIVGASGYTSLETIKWLLRHPHVRITYLASRKAEQPISTLFPELAGRCELPIRAFDPVAIAAEADVAFLCLPHVAAMEHAPQLLAAGVRVIDLSADYRLTDPTVYEHWYKHKHSDLPNLAQAVYGLPELFADQIKQAKFVSNPGCYPTAAALGLIPLLANGMADPTDLIISAASGISGAGRTPKQEHHYPERNENFEAYAIGTHRHTPEIEQTVSRVLGNSVKVIFVPHLIPVDRGILETIFLPARPGFTQTQAEAAFTAYYAGQPFVRIRTQQLPAIKYVANTNCVDIAVKLAGTRWVVSVAIDNMVKGASGQAIQNMNLMFGRPMTEGLL